MCIPLDVYPYLNVAFFPACRYVVIGQQHDHHESFSDLGISDGTIVEAAFESVRAFERNLPLDVLTHSFFIGRI